MKYVKLKSASAIEKGNVVKHPKFGKCKVIQIDTKTYSIPMATVEILEGRFKGEKIYRSLDEFKKA